MLTGHQKKGKTLVSGAQKNLNKNMYTAAVLVNDSTYTVMNKYRHKGK